MHRFPGGAQRLRQRLPRLLACAQHDIIHGEQVWLAANSHMQPLVIDFLVAHRRHHLHSAGQQRRPVDPAGGFAQPFARLTGFALQHHNLARAFWQLRPLRAQAAHLIEAGVDAPFHTELGNILAGGIARLAEVHRRIKPDAAAADNGDVLAHRHFIAQHIEIAEHFGMRDPRDRRRARLNAAGEDHLVKRRQAICRDPLVQPQIDPGYLDHSPVVAQRLIKLLFAGDLFGDIKLAADLRLRVKQRHAMAAQGGVNGKCQPGRASAHHRQRFFILRRAQGHFGFMAGARVNQAGGHFPCEDLVEAGLVAANTGIDLIRPAIARFREDLRVGEERASHRDHIRIATGEDRFRHLRIVDAVGGDKRYADLAFKLAGDPAKRAARHRGGDSGDARLMPADAGVDKRRACRFHGLCQLQRLFKHAAAFHQIQHRQAIDNDKFRPDPFPHGAHHLDGKAHAAGVVAAPFVAALVSAGGEKFIDQIAFRTHHLYAVVSRLLRQLRAAGEVINQRQDLIMAELMGREAVNGRADGRRGHQLRLVAVAPGVQDLQGDFAPFLMYGASDELMMRQLLLVVKYRAAFHGDAAERGGPRRR